MNLAARAAALLAIVGGTLLIGSAPALAYSGVPHEHTAAQTVLTFDLAMQPYLAPPNQPPTPLVQRDSPIPIFPELNAISVSWENGNEPGTVPAVDADNGTIVWWNATSPDQWEFFDYSQFGCPAATPATMTIRHFWDPDIGGAIGMVAGPLRPTDLRTCTGVPELCPDPLLLCNSDLYPNAWVKARLHWSYALMMWRRTDIPEDQRKYAQGWAYLNLGHAIHLLFDMGQPAHTHEDMHNESDSLEEWFKDDLIRGYYSWFPPNSIPTSTPTVAAATSTDGAAPPGMFPVPGDLLYPPSNADACAKIMSTSFTGSTGRYDDPIYLGNDYTLLIDCMLGGPDNLGQLFYLFYVVNQIGDYYPSDEYDGDSSDSAGWLNGYAGFPTVTEENSPIQSHQILDDNDGPPNNDDGDLSEIVTGLTRWQRDMYGLGAGHYGAYQAAFMATHSMIDLFRKTIDGVPPVTEFSLTRGDGQPVSSSWNTSAVTATVTGATDSGRLGSRPSGVAAVLGRWNGIDKGLGESWTLPDGKHVIQGMSYDNSGAVDNTTDVTVWVDTTPPEVTFPALRPNYLTSESFTAMWNATDALSGIASEVAYLDGALISKSDVVDLSARAGKHRLEVYAWDEAGNWRYEYYDFEVWIDTQADVKPVRLNRKWNGGGMKVMVEFPAPHNVGAIDVRTCRLRLGATIDLHEKDPVMGGNATLVGEILTGVGDRDHDDVNDRKIRFDKEQFADAVAGKTGDIKAVVWGHLSHHVPHRFIGPVTIQMLTPPG
jgi:hypothetical protein